jgi:uncharacterized transporter YbjL
MWWAADDVQLLWGHDTKRRPGKSSAGRSSRGRAAGETAAARLAALLECPMCPQAAMHVGSKHMCVYVVLAPLHRFAVVYVLLQCVHVVVGLLMTCSCSGAMTHSGGLVKVVQDAAAEPERQVRPGCRKACSAVYSQDVHVPKRSGESDDLGRKHACVYVVLAYTSACVGCGSMYAVRSGGLLMTCSCSGAMTQSGGLAKVVQDAAAEAERQVRQLPHNLQRCLQQGYTRAQTAGVHLGCKHVCVM